MKKETLQFVSFVAIGGFGAGSYVILSYLVTCAGLQPWLASFLVYIGLVPIVYLLQRNFAFRSSVPHGSSFPKYLAIQTLGIVLSGILPYVLIRLSIPAVDSFFAVVVFITTVNYALQRRWAFHQED